MKEFIKGVLDNMFKTMVIVVTIILIIIILGAMSGKGFITERSSTTHVSVQYNGQAHGPYGSMFK